MAICERCDNEGAKPHNDLISHGWIWLCDECFESILFTNRCDSLEKGYKVSLTETLETTYKPELTELIRGK